MAICPWKRKSLPREAAGWTAKARSSDITLAIRNGTDSSAVGSVAGEARASFASLVSRVVSSGTPATASVAPVFILKTGAVLAVGNYRYHDGRITYTLASGGGGVVSSDEVDWTTTTRVNS